MTIFLVGNDIVDLAEEGGKHHLGFPSRILAPVELARYYSLQQDSLAQDSLAQNIQERTRRDDSLLAHALLVPDLPSVTDMPVGISSAEYFLWTAWTAKEAAYKYLRQQDCDIQFLPNEYIYDPELSSVAYVDSRQGISDHSGVEIPSEVGLGERGGGGPPLVCVEYLDESRPIKPIDRSVPQITQSKYVEGIGSNLSSSTQDSLFYEVPVDHTLTNQFIYCRAGCLGEQFIDLISASRNPSLVKFHNASQRHYGLNERCIPLFCEVPDEAQNESQRVRALVTNYYDQVASQEITFYKNPVGIPYMESSSGDIIPVSLTHHGRFVAAAVARYLN